MLEFDPDLVDHKWVNLIFTKIKWTSQFIDNNHTIYSKWLVETS